MTKTVYDAAHGDRELRYIGEMHKPKGRQYYNARRDRTDTIILSDQTGLPVLFIPPLCWKKMVEAFKT